MLIDSFAAWIRTSPHVLTTVKQVVGYLHSASLMIDDIEDGSSKRRGFDSAHVVHGVAATLNAANYVYFLALDKLHGLGEAGPLASAIFCMEMLNLHRGQGRDIYWREKQIIPSEAEYMDMIKDKTGGLFRMAVRLLDVAQDPELVEEALALEDLKLDGDPNLVAYLDMCDLLAQYFQIRDDLLNLASGEYTAQKGLAEDITEGKISFLIIVAVKNLKSQGKDAQIKALLDILALHTDDAETKRRAMAILTEGQAFAQARTKLADIKRNIDMVISKLGGNASLVKILEKLERDVQG